MFKIVVLELKMVDLVFFIFIFHLQFYLFNVTLLQKELLTCL